MVLLKKNKQNVSITCDFQCSFAGDSGDSIAGNTFVFAFIFSFDEKNIEQRIILFQRHSRIVAIWTDFVIIFIPSNCGTRYARKFASHL